MLNQANTCISQGKDMQIQPKMFAQDENNYCHLIDKFSVQIVLEVVCLSFIQQRYEFNNK